MLLIYEAAASAAVAADGARVPRRRPLHPQIIFADPTVFMYESV